MTSYEIDDFEFDHELDIYLLDYESNDYMFNHEVNDDLFYPDIVDVVSCLSRRVWWSLISSLWRFSRRCVSCSVERIGYAFS